MINLILIITSFILIESLNIPNRVANPNGPLFKTHCEWIKSIHKDSRHTESPFDDDLSHSESSKGIGIFNGVLTSRNKGVRCSSSETRLTKTVSTSESYDLNFICKNAGVIVDKPINCNPKVKIAYMYNGFSSCFSDGPEGSCPSLLFNAPQIEVSAINEIELSLNDEILISKGYKCENGNDVTTTRSFELSGNIGQSSKDGLSANAALTFGTSIESKNDFNLDQNNVLVRFTKNIDFVGPISIIINSHSTSQISAIGKVMGVSTSFVIGEALCIMTSSIGCESVELYDEIGSCAKNDDGERECNNFISQCQSMKKIFQIN
jgi:hypothetical protein